MHTDKGIYKHTHTHTETGTHPHFYMDIDAHTDPGTWTVRQEYGNLHTQRETHQWTEATHGLRYTHMDRKAKMDIDTSRHKHMQTQTH
jgi:hypothetical protein